MKLQDLDPSGYRRTPWKNGGGITVDIADAYEPGAAPGGWSGMIWRFGRTRIERPGPFSDLSGYERILTVIEGRGLKLWPRAAPVIDVTEPFRPVRFPGEWAIESELEAGPVGVLNLMADRERTDIDVLVLKSSDTASLDADIAVLHAPAGEAHIRLDGRPFALAPDHALRLDADSTLQVVVETGVIAVASIRLKR